MSDDGYRAYFEAASLLSRIARSRAERILRDLAGGTEPRRARGEQWVEEIFERGRRLTEELVDIVRTEVGSQLGALGLDPDELARQAADILRRTAEAGRRASEEAADQWSPWERDRRPSGGGANPAEDTATTSSTIRSASTAKSPTKRAPAKKAMAKKTPAKKATASPAPSKKAPAKKATASPAPSKKAPAKKATTSPAPSKMAPAKKATTSPAPSKMAPAKKAPAKKAPGQSARTAQAATKRAPARRTGAATPARRPRASRSAAGTGGGGPAPDRG